ncbi:MAG: hypothetical protein MK110_14750 [Fuerstiella sp.]|nr:hypothetical protein [Fuerstiella sp.]
MSKIVTGLAMVLAVTATQAFAADGQISETMLSAFGLSDVQVVSDVDGMNVRGQGSFTYVSGGSASGVGIPFGGSGTINRYKAGSLNRGTSDSAGGSESVSYGVLVRERVAANGDVSSLTRSVEVGSAGGAWASSR